VGDLAGLDLPERFDAVVCAGNVMTFAAPATRVEILRRFAAHLAPGVDDGGFMRRAR
jgi:chemotaxis methyl-accepting protein methylase